MHDEEVDKFITCPLHHTTYKTAFPCAGKQKTDGNRSQMIENNFPLRHPSLGVPAITFRDTRNVECPHVWEFEWKLNYNLEKNMFWHLSLGLNMIGWSQKECRMPRYLKSLGPGLSGADSTIFRLDRLDNIAATFGISTVCQVNQKLHNYPAK